MTKQPDTQYSRSNSLFKGESEETWLARRFSSFKRSSVRTATPPFPRQVMFEVTNICNHACSFCAYTTMTRARRQMDRPLFLRLASEAYELGAREIGLFSGAEPLTCKHLEEYIAHASELGFEYIYISTNGSIGEADKYKGLIDAGLDSIKFSINAGERERYARIHGRDDFDRVVSNVDYVCAYRKTLDRDFRIMISFVEIPENAGDFDLLKARFDSKVDEMVLYEANNQSGQMVDLPDPGLENCELPFNRVNISREGYMRACCNDYENALALENLNDISLADAWHSEHFRRLRQRHLDDDLAGTLCGSCLRGCHDKIDPINPQLATVRQDG